MGAIVAYSGESRLTRRGLIKITCPKMDILGQAPDPPDHGAQIEFWIIGVELNKRAS